MARSKAEPLVRASIFVRHLFIGMHHWPGAPAGSRYLRLSHRHVFHLRVECVVDHADRAVEFHRLQRAVRNCVAVAYPPARENPEARECGERSCESIAKDLLLALRGTYAGVRAVECGEDGENGARVEVVR